MCERKYAKRIDLHQRGVVLIVALIMVLLMTIIGVAAIRGSNLQELMAGNMRDRNLGFQAAEAGLRAGESVIRTELNIDGLLFDGSQPGYMPHLNTGGRVSPFYWSDAEWEGAALETNMNLKLASDIQPRYVVEKLEVPAVAAAAEEANAIDAAGLDAFEAPEYFRVTSRGMGGTTDSDIIIQSVYKR